MIDRRAFIATLPALTAAFRQLAGVGFPEVAGEAVDIAAAVQTPEMVDGARWIRVTMDTDNLTGTSAVKFYQGPRYDPPVDIGEIDWEEVPGIVGDRELNFEQTEDGYTFTMEGDPIIKRMKARTYHGTVDTIQREPHEPSLVEVDGGEWGIGPPRIDGAKLFQAQVRDEDGEIVMAANFQPSKAEEKWRELWKGNDFLRL